MIAKITRVYVRHYTDNGQTRAIADWIDSRGRTGSTSGNIERQYGAHGHRHRHRRRRRAPVTFDAGEYMHALFARAKREGLRLERETW